MQPLFTLIYFRTGSFSAVLETHLSNEPRYQHDNNKPISLPVSLSSACQSSPRQQTVWSVQFSLWGSLAESLLWVCAALHLQEDAQWHPQSRAPRWDPAHHSTSPRPVKRISYEPVKNVWEGILGQILALYSAQLYSIWEMTFYLHYCCSLGSVSKAALAAVCMWCKRELLFLDSCICIYSFSYRELAVYPYRMQ